MHFPRPSNSSTSGTLRTLALNVLMRASVSGAYLRRAMTNLPPPRSATSLRIDSTSWTVLFSCVEVAPRGVERRLKFGDSFPDGVTVGADHHASFDDLSGLRHIALKNHVLIPCGEILAAWRDERIRHFNPIFSVSSVLAVARSKFVAATARSAWARTSRVRATMRSVCRWSTRKTVEVPD